MQTTDLRYLGRRLHIWTGGAGPALLLLHSAWVDAKMGWSTVWNELARTFTVIAPDMPGFGASEAAEVPSLAGIAGMLKHLLDDRGMDRAVVIGNSFGVAVAIEFASLYPAMTAKLVAVNGVYLPSLPGWMKRIIALPGIRRHFQKTMRKMTYSNDAFRSAFPDRAALPPAFFDHIRMNEEQHAHVVFEAFMHQKVPQTRPGVPAAIMWGAADRLASTRQAKKMLKWLDVPQVHRIEGAGHMPQLDQPREFVYILRHIAAT